MAALRLGVHEAGFEQHVSSGCHNALTGQWRSIAHSAIMSAHSAHLSAARSHEGTTGAPNLVLLTLLTLTHIWQLSAPTLPSTTHLSQQHQVLTLLADNGMNVARLNMTHGNHAWHDQVVQHIRRLNSEKG